MRRAVGFVLGVALVLAAASSSASFAAIEEDGWEIEFYLGRYDPGPSVVDSDTLWGMRIGRNVGTRGNLFADFGRFDVGGTIANPSPPPDTAKLGGDLRIFDFDYGYNFTPENKWVTMLYGGIGWTLADIDASTGAPVSGFFGGLGDDSFTVNVGAAGKLQVSERIFIRFDARGHWNLERDEDEFDVGYSVGFGWMFGG